MEDYNITDLIVHAPFIINLATPEIYKWHLSVKTLKEEYDRCKAIGSKVLILHPGNYTTSTEPNGLKNIIKGLMEVLKDRSGVTICLETMAGKGTEIGWTFEQLMVIARLSPLKNKIGICLDTCHMWDAGYDIKDRFDIVIEHFKKLLPLDMIKCIHLNDSKNPRGSHKDRHANIGEGYIGLEALKNILNYHEFSDIPFILETPNERYAEEIKLLKF